MVDISNSSVQRAVTDPSIPGFQMTIPAGVTITGWDGQPNTQVSVRQVPIDRIPLPPLPGDRVGVSAYMDYFGKPGGGTPSAPIPITFPNDLGAPPGTQVELWFYDEAPDGSRPNQMAKYGTGTVSADGSQIVPDIDPSTGKSYGQPRFCCGYVMPAWLRATLDFINNLLKGAATSLAKVLGGEPVDLATGQFVLEKTDMVLPGRLPVTVTRTYHSGGTAQGPFGRGTTYSYDVSLLIQSDQRTLFLPAGQRVVFRKQADGTFLNLTDPAYRSVVLTAVGNGHSLRFKDGAVWTFGTPSENLSFLTSQADRNGNTLTFTRTGTLGMLTAITDSAGRQLSLSYDGSSRITQITDPIGRLVRYSYDGSGRLARVDDPAGGATFYTYDTNGRMLTLTDARGITFLTNQYDSNGRVIQQTQADGGVWLFAYNTSAGMITQTVVTDPAGKKTTHRFNGQGYPLEQKDDLGQTTVSTRNEANQVTATTDALGRKPTFTYDAAGNTTSIIDPAGNVTRFEYEPIFNRVTKITDALNNVTTFTYDANGNLRTTTDPLNKTTTIAYNSFGQPTSVTDPLNNATTFEYDATGNLTATNDPLGNRTTRVYDSVSRLIEVTDPRGFPTDFTYDGLNRVTQINDAFNGLTSFSYDPNGNLLSVTDAKNQSTTYTYDKLDRLATRKDALNRTESYQYDPAGNLTQFLDRKNQTSTFTYDSLNRRIGASYAGGSSTSFTYDNGTSTSYTYDTASRLTNILHQGPTSTIESITYTYDAAGNRINLIRANSTATNLPAAVQAAYDAANEQIKFGNPLPPSPNLTYDANGNLTNDGTNTYTWDARNRLTAISGGVSASFTYDALGRRISKTISGQTTQFLYDGNDIVLESGASGVANYLRSLNIDEPFVRQSSSNEFYHTDALGSVLTLTGQTGAVQTTYNYEAFGKTTIAGASTNPFQYTGRENDGTGFYHYRRRYYSSTIQRYLREDPLRLVGGS